MEQELKTEATRKLILEKAFHLFYKNGFKATSINEIMKATPLSKGAFYHNFKNKDEIGILVVKSEMKTLIYNTMIIPLEIEGEAKSVLRNAFYGKIQTFSDEEKLMGCPVNNLVNEIRGIPNLMNDVLKELIDTWVAAIIKIIERGHKDGSISLNTNAEETAIYLVSSFQGMRGIQKLYSNNDRWHAYQAALKSYIDKL